MRSLSDLGIGLSFVFGCLFLALIAEVYYLLWWKKRLVNRDMEQEDYNSSTTTREFMDLFCWKKPLSMNSRDPTPVEIRASTRITDDSGNGSARFKPLGGGGEDGFTTFQNHFPDRDHPRLLFTIEEETEDLESQDGCSSRMSLGDVVVMETPYVTPFSSPPFCTPPLTPMNCRYDQHGFNPLFESFKEDGSIWVTAPSPPPKFKFLRDAEEKHCKKTLKSGEQDEHVQVQVPIDGQNFEHQQEDGSFITINIK